VQVVHDAEELMKGDNAAISASRSDVIAKLAKSPEMLLVMKTAEADTLDAAEQIDMVKDAEHGMDTMLRKDIKEIRSNFDNKKQDLGEAGVDRMTRFLSQANRGLDRVEEADKRLRGEEATEVQEDKIEKDLHGLLEKFQRTAMGEVLMGEDKGESESASLEAEINSEIANESKKLVSLKTKTPAPDFKTPLGKQLAKHKKKAAAKPSKSSILLEQEMYAFKKDTKLLINDEKASEKTVQSIEALLHQGELEEEDYD